MTTRDNDETLFRDLAEELLLLASLLERIPRVNRGNLSERIESEVTGISNANARIWNHITELRAELAGRSAIPLNQW